MIDEYLPESSIRRHSKDKPFITNKVKSLIIKRNKVHNSGNVESFKLLRAQVAKEIRIAKSTFYDQKVRPKQTACSKSWWKHIKCLSGKKKAGVTLFDPETKLELNGKQSATVINDFFADLTKDYPMIDDQWL